MWRIFGDVLLLDLRKAQAKEGRPEPGKLRNRITPSSGGPGAVDSPTLLIDY